LNLHEQIVDRLQALAPDSLNLEDESSQHAGHAGAAGGGGHFRLTIISSRFAGLNAVARHRLVYEILGDLMRGPIHALAIIALTPEEL
jgi:BolA protein